MGRAAESEVVNRLGRGVPIAAGFKLEGAQTKLEFRKEADGSVLVFNTYCFPRTVNFMKGKHVQEFSSPESLATATLITRIRAESGHILHEVESFEIIPGKSQQSKAILEQLYKYEPQFAELKQYVVGTSEYAANQGVLQDSQCQGDWEVIDIGPDGATTSHSILDAEMTDKMFTELKFTSEFLEHAVKQKKETIKTIQEYIADKATKEIFGNAAMVEMIYKLHQARRMWDGHNLEQQRKFVNNPDGSVSVIETVTLPKKMFDMDNDSTSYESDENIATVALVTRVREKDGHISHEIESFVILPGESEKSKAIFEDLCKKPVFAELKQYVVGTAEYAARQIVMDSQTQGDPVNRGVFPEFCVNNF